MTRPIDTSPWSIEKKLVVDRIKEVVTFFREMDATEVTVGPVHVKFREPTQHEVKENYALERVAEAHKEWTEMPEEERMALEEKRREQLFYHSS